ncbi:MAG TPA: DUF481 domain-containing protein [Candidatus Latescibacteria bacterium]|jgi:hypothetical protein|nr:DUF481 domain-containing protein [Candidatus Latescibacterota bacterium]HJP32397.1 DUF481 domain-containing protein [Candidatus Latescibacterota bacterium]
MHRRILICIMLVIIWTVPSAAQVNIETYRGKAGLAGAARFSVSSDFGNVDVVRSDGAGNVTLDNDTGALLLVVRGAAGFLGGKRYANSGVLHLRYTWKVSTLIHPEIFVQGDYARSRRLDARSLVGIGGRWNLLRTERQGLAIGSAIMWERERLDLLPGDRHDSRTSEARLSTYINLYAATSRGVSLATTAYYQPAVTDVGDARLLGTVELTTPIIGPLQQTTVIDFRVDRGAPRGVKDTDVKLSASFGVKFG